MIKIMYNNFRGDTMDSIDIIILTIFIVFLVVLTYHIKKNDAAQA